MVSIDSHGCVTKRRALSAVSVKSFVGSTVSSVVNVKIESGPDVSRASLNTYNHYSNLTVVMSVLETELELDNTCVDESSVKKTSQKIPVIPESTAFLPVDDVFSIKFEPVINCEITSFSEYEPQMITSMPDPIKIDSKVNVPSKEQTLSIVKIEPDIETNNNPTIPIIWMPQARPETLISRSFERIGRTGEQSREHRARKTVLKEVEATVAFTGSNCDTTKCKRLYSSIMDPLDDNKDNNQSYSFQESIISTFPIPTKIITEPVSFENKSAAELVREYTPRIKELWKANKLAAKKPPAKSSAERMREYRAWIKTLGEAGDPIAKIMAERAAEYTRRRRERIKALAEAGDPNALAIVKRATEYPRERRARIKALAAAGDPAAKAMVKRAAEYPRKRRARIKALAEAGDPTAKIMAKREAECMRKYRARKRELREAGDPSAIAAAKRMNEYYREYRARKKAMRGEAIEVTIAPEKNSTEYGRKRRARMKALAEAGDTAALEKAKRMTEYYRVYRARQRALREAGDPVAVAAAKRTAEYYKEYRTRKKCIMKGASQS